MVEATNVNMSITGEGHNHSLSSLQPKEILKSVVARVNTNLDTIFL